MYALVVCKLRGKKQQQQHKKKQCERVIIPGLDWRLQHTHTHTHLSLSRQERVGVTGGKCVCVVGGVGG